MDERDAVIVQYQSFFKTVGMMNAIARSGARFLSGLLLLSLYGVSAEEKPAAPAAAQVAKEHDGQHDFDFEIGTWKTHLRRRLHPLTGSTTWVEMDGTTLCRKVWDGRANILELVADGGGVHFEGLSLRLYNEQTHQWSLNFSHSGDGTMALPTIGGFKDGRGDFYDQETLNGRAIFVRFVISDITADSARFEQSFSGDGGKTWEVNWIAVDTRIKDGAEAAH